MATTTNSLEITLSYSNTNYTRTYKIPDVKDSAIPDIKSKIEAYNSNIPAADKKVFISDDYDASDPDEIIGEFEKISSARLVTVTESKVV